MNNAAFQSFLSGCRFASSKLAALGSRSLVFLLLIGFANFTGGVAHATILEIQGGQGGSPFEQTCPTGMYMSGLRAQAGAWVVGLGIICSKPGAINITQDVWAGGKGASPQAVYCRENQPLTGLDLRFTRGKEVFLDVAILMCNHSTRGEPNCISSGEGCHPGEKFEQSGVHKYGGSVCPDDEVARGIHGRAGIYINAIALICGPMPAVIPERGQASSAPASRPIKILRKRANSSIAPGQAATDAEGAPSPGACAAGYVWRVARPEDRVCVTPASRSTVLVENKLAAHRVDPNNAPNCLSGYVWREAFDGDVACVAPQRRSEVKAENAAAESHLAK